MILCHKCSGVLTAGTENATGLLGCGCMSGWVRGFEPILTRAEGIKAQLKRQRDIIQWKTERGDSVDEIAKFWERISALESLD